MKKIILSFLVIMGMTTFVSSQVSVSYNIGKNFNKVAVGYNINSKIVPYFGFQYFGAKFSGSADGEEDVSTSASAFMPNLGLKFYLINKENLKAGLNIGTYKPFFSFKNSDKEIEEDVKKVIKKSNVVISELGFISEYYINPAFSIGGEFGIRLLSGTFDDEIDGDKIEAKSNFNFTYTSFSLNYHF